MTRRTNKFKFNIKRIFVHTAIIAATALFFCLSGWQAVPAYAAGASLYMSPSTGTKVIGSRFSVSVKVDSGGQVINAAEGAVSYDSNLLDVAGISKSGSIFSLWTVEPVASGGTIKFGGGIPRPGYNGSAGQICTITFKAKKAGTAQVRFTSGAVLANDGKGTNILASMGSASFTVAPASQAPAAPSGGQTQPTEKPAPAHNQPVIHSSTHPDQNAWYSNASAKFSWTLPDGVTGVSIAFDQNPDTDPGPLSDGLFSEKAYTADNDGVWYVHVKFKDNTGWGTIAHYRIMVDTAVPTGLQAEVKDNGVGEWPDLHFQAQDKTSGIKQYQILIDNLAGQARIASATTNLIKLDGLAVGKHTAIVKAVDKAGNEAYTQVSFTIQPIPSPVIKNYPTEIKSSDKFFMNGTALPNAKIAVFIKQGDTVVASGTVESDANGNWFYISPKSFVNNRYVAWAEATNQNGITSGPSAAISFLVTPPVFTRIGSFVINYFTVFVSLIFLVVLIVAMILFIASLIRKRLKKETSEVEEILKRNAADLKQAVDAEFGELEKAAGKTGFKKEQAKSKARLKLRIDENVRKSLKEVKDVEDILK